MPSAPRLRPLRWRTPRNNVGYGGAVPDARPAVDRLPGFWGSVLVFKVVL